MAAQDASEFADLLRRYRRRSGLTQGELAERAGLSPAAVSLLERGITQAPHRDTIQLLVTALELAPDEAALLARAGRRARSVDTAPTAPADVPAAPPSAAAPATPAPAASPPGEASSPALPSYRLAPPLTPLLGREHEEAGVVHLLAQERVRLLTLTGPAGVGKTRLALQIAATLHERHDFEPALVDLVAVPAAEQVPQAIARALGVRQTGDLPLLDALTAAIGGRRLLLVLDNFEHVLPAAPLCAALLGACPNAKALVTSRAALNVRGEHEFAVPPLRVPDLGGLPPLAELERFGAVALFVERVRAARPDFALRTPERGRLVAAICARLDGLPLAIELAAAQVRHFRLEEIVARLQGAAPLDLLVGGPRDLADHQRAMRSTIAWSYSLLPSREQRVFRALGVFAGGATLDGVEMVAELGEEPVTESLAALADASLIFRADPPGDQPSETRYDLPVIVRAFAVERLREAGELDATRRRLADYVVGMVEQLSPTAATVQTAPLNRLLREHDNLRAVLDWLLRSGELPIGLRLLRRLRVFWESRGLVAEGAAWLERLLARAESPRTPEEREGQVDAWAVLVIMRHRLGRFQDAAAAAERVLALTREQGNPGKIAQALHYLANPLARLGEFDRAEAMLLESLAIDRAAGDKTSEMISLVNLGELRSFQGRYGEALAIQQGALAISRALAEREPWRGLILASLGETYILLDRPAEARDILLESQRVFETYDEPNTMALCGLGRACWRLGAAGEALGYLERAAQRSRPQDDVAALVQELCVLAGVALDQCDLALARPALDEAVATQARVGDSCVRWRVVERVAGYACRLGDWEIAVRLYAAAEQGRTRTYDLVDPAECDLRARDRAAARDALGPDAFAAAEDVDALLSLLYALELARAALARTRPD